MGTKKPRSVIAPRFVIWQLFAAILMFGFVLPMVPDAMSVKAALFMLGGVILALFSYVIRLLEYLVRHREKEEALEHLAQQKEADARTTLRSAPMP